MWSFTLSIVCCHRRIEQLLDSFDKIYFCSSIYIHEKSKHVLIENVVLSSFTSIYLIPSMKHIRCKKDKDSEFYPSFPVEFSMKTIIKMHSLFVFLVFTLCPLDLMITRVTCENVHFPTADTNKKCIVKNEMYWKVIQWFYGPLSFIDVNAIIQPNETQSINQLSSVFLREISNSSFLLLK